ncbi:iron complex transport system permease protein [Amycolatopsis marina]|uniref:Iron complex transport system permease protein n=1 Tax=Amycolatopsis marina TaxID=490629 RepID=A0A1I1ASD8_9PSEU|nr:iron ABC transporter permease [Amycolatopsis marina]SFB40336.1 iron complex transport system permease protein [Amycolatopsis marina]
MTPAPAAAPPRDRQRGVLLASQWRVAGMAGAACLLLAACCASLALGSVPLPVGTVFEAVFAFDGSNEHLIVREMRLPRTLIGLGVGAALAVAGGLMQAVTRNPLAEPGILGINAGAAFGVVGAVHLFGVVSPTGYVWFAFAGAALSVVVVYLLGGTARSATSPVKLALAGVVVTMLLHAWTTLVLVFDQRTLDEVRFWLAGSLAGRGDTVLALTAPLLLTGLAAGLLVSRQLNALSLGEQMASALGQRTVRVRISCGAIVVVLAGAAVAAAGPIGFVGLAVPHIARALVGPDYRWILAYGVLLGPVLLLVADVAGRIIARPSEVQVGIVTAVLGAPLLIWLVRRRKVASV